MRYLSRTLFLHLFLLVFCLWAGFSPGLLPAQSSGAQISWDDDDEEEEGDDVGAIAADIPVVEDVTILVNGEEFDLKDDMEFEKEKVLEVSIRYLRPNSWVSVQLQKAGMKLTQQRYQANELGELDLEIKTGKQKVKGTAKIWYTPNGSKERKERNVKVKVV
ncbi:MAG: hypothetical protein H6581_10990 [Bacteroidia bacterium]|nr:hypothetical protein [Bacteroidia bacterium]